jgi:hypothetical protein
MPDKRLTAKVQSWGRDVVTFDSGRATGTSQLLTASITKRLVHDTGAASLWRERTHIDDAGDPRLAHTFPWSLRYRPVLLA